MSRCRASVTQTAAVDLMQQHLTQHENTPPVSNKVDCKNRCHQGCPRQLCAAARSTGRCQPNSSWPEWYYSRRSRNTDGTVFNILWSQAVPSSSLCPCRNHLQSAAKGRYNFTRRKACFQHCSDLLPKTVRPAEGHRCVWGHVFTNYGRS